MQDVPIERVASGAVRRYTARPAQRKDSGYKTRTEESYLEYFRRGGARVSTVFPSLAVHPRAARVNSSIVPPHSLPRPLHALHTHTDSRLPTYITD